MLYDGLVNILYDQQINRTFIELEKKIINKKIKQNIKILT